MKFTDEQQEAMEAVKFNARIDWQTRRQLDTNAHDFAYLDGYDDGYAAAKSETCKWTTYVDLEGSYWATQCVEVFRDKHNFCPDCGRKIQVVERDKTGENYAE